jgi:hypothetical protein
MSRPAGEGCIVPLMMRWLLTHLLQQPTPKLDPAVLRLSPPPPNPSRRILHQVRCARCFMHLWFMGLFPLGFIAVRALNAARQSPQQRQLQRLLSPRPSTTPSLPSFHLSLRLQRCAYPSALLRGCLTFCFQVFGQMNTKKLEAAKERIKIADKKIFQDPQQV